MQTVPILIRTRNRHVYVDETIRSLLATKIPADIPIIILDDCSDNEETLRYYTTPDKIQLKEPINWDIHKPLFDRLIQGHLNGMQTEVTGLNNIIEVVKPETRRGVRGGIYWCVDYGFKRFPEADRIHVIEADAIFHEDWYQVSLDGYNACEKIEGPNGDHIGLFSAYDRKGSPSKDYGWHWRSLKRLRNGSVSCSNGIGGVHYLVSREFYNRTPAFQNRYPVGQRGGDTAIQGTCFCVGCNIATTKPSMIQHVGIVSTAWPSKGWRHTKNFKLPFACLGEQEWLDLKLKGERVHGAD